jgi:hypothetical protein
MSLEMTATSAHCLIYLYSLMGFQVKNIVLVWLVLNSNIFSDSGGIPIVT